jgi:hypothetical protein
MIELYKTLHDCFIKRNIMNSHSNLPHQIHVKDPQNYKSLDSIYLGARVTEYVLYHNLSTEQLHILRARCLDFYIEGATQIQNRFDFSSSVLQNMELLNPHVIFNEDRESIMPLATHFPNLVTKNNLQALDLEWRQLRNSNLKFDDNASICTFWLKVENEKYADTTPVYPLLSKFALNLLSLPHSSANVERIFSQVNLLKTKQRNRLSTSTIVGLLHSKSYIKSECFNLNFRIPPPPGGTAILPEYIHYYG